MMKTFVAAAIILNGWQTIVLAQVPTSPPAPVPTIAATPRGPGIVSGSSGPTQSVMVPGSAVPGTLMNNGNGTTTVMIPGSPSEVIPTPR
jgi:hypothetical protein